MGKAIFSCHSVKLNQSSSSSIDNNVIQYSERETQFSKQLTRLSFEFQNDLLTEFGKN